MGRDDIGYARRAYWFVYVGNDVYYLVVMLSTFLKIISEYANFGGGENQTRRVLRTKFEKCKYY